MSYQTIVYGRIISGGALAANKAVIESPEREQAFPWIQKEMFSFPMPVSPYSFYEPVITFGATYKQLEDDISAWLIKFEHILTQLDFITAKIQVETELYGNYDFFWRSRAYLAGHHDDAYFREMDLYPAEKWYYGYGNRDRWGMPEDGTIADTMQKLQEIHRMQHPYIITDAHKDLLQQLYEAIPPGKRVYFYDLPGELTRRQDILFPLLTKLATEHKLIFKTSIETEPGFEGERGPYIIR